MDKINQLKAAAECGFIAVNTKEFMCTAEQLHEFVDKVLQAQAQAHKNTYNLGYAHGVADAQDVQ